jgi:hypothetical protein
MTIEKLRFDMDVLMQTQPETWPPAQLLRAKAIAFDLTRYAAYFGRPATADGAWVYQSLQKLQAIINARNPLVS